MEAPRLYIPRERLLMPLGAPDEYDYELIRKSRPRVVKIPPLSMRNLIGLHYPDQPLWEEAPDGTMATLYVVSGEHKGLFTHLVDGVATGPQNADGQIFRYDQLKVFSHGVLQDDGEAHIWWGVANFDLDPTEPAMPPGMTSVISVVDDDAYRDVDLRMFPR